MAQQVWEGTWEEVSRHADRLSGKRVRVTVIEGSGRGEGSRPANRAVASPAERARGFRQWAESHSPDSPILSDEAISRESIYSSDRD